MKVSNYKYFKSYLLKRIVILFFIMGAVLICYGNNILLDSLINKEIYLIHVDRSVDSWTSPFVYTSDAQKKEKKFDFKKEYIYNPNIIGRKIKILEVFRIPNNKNPKEIIIKADLNNNNAPVLIRIPLKNNEEGGIYSARWLMDKEGKKSFIYDASEDDLILPFVTPEQIDSLNEKFKEKIIYPIKKNNIIKTSFGQNEYYHAFEYGEPYKFIGISFDTPLRFPFGNTLAKEIFIIGENEDQTIIKVPIKVYDWNFEKPNSNKDLTIDNLTSVIVSEEDLLELTKEKIDTTIYNNILEHWLGEDIYFDSSHYNRDSEEVYQIINKKRNFIRDPSSDYYKLDDLKWYPSKKNAPLLHPYIIIKNSSYTIAVPINKSLDLALIKSDEYKERVRQEELLNEQKIKEQEEEREKREANYKQELIKKYGKNNADLILSHNVKIGFSKEMCLESWGSPYDTTSLTTQYGKTEAWLYYSGKILYFQKNKLIMIID